MENWKPVTIPEFGHYEVSDIGRVRNSKTGNVFSNNLTPAGRHRVQLRAGGGYYKNLLVHRLVCLAFNGEPPEDKPLTLHRDGNPLNNVPENLYWGDDADNSRDRHLHGRTTRMNATHCVNGHEFTPENTRLRKSNGKRMCKQCQLDNAKKYQKMGLPEGDPGHGTLRGYVSRGCRCPLCVEWGVFYRKMLKERRSGSTDNE